MKQIISILSIWLLGICCVFSQAVSKETAETVARNFMQEQGMQLQSKNQSQVQTMQAPSAKISKSISYSHNGKTPSYHVVKFDKGFVIVSGREEVKPIVGYSLDGTFDENNISPAFTWWMEGFLQMTDSLEKLPVKAKLQMVDNKWDFYKSNIANVVLESQTTTQATTTGNAVGPLLKSTWDQGHPYNRFAPETRLGCSNGRCYAGCVAVAIGQVMYYWGYPIKSFYNWCDMQNNLTPSSNSKSIEAVATLLSHIGLKVGMVYCQEDNERNATCASGAYTDNSIPVLESYGYNINPTMKREDYYSITMNELNNRRPVLIGSSTGLHTFVIDGYDSQGRLHFNLGWGGSEDGFYEYGAYKYAPTNAYICYGISPEDKYIEDCNSVYDLDALLSVIPTKGF